jgi:VanZ family protein
LHTIIRKCGHFSEYGFLSYLLFRGIRGRNKRLNLKWITYAGLITIGYGALDEFLQTFISSRTGSAYDWMIDSAGTVFVLTFIYIKGSYK